jgi:DNA topoisomerase-1
MHDEHVRVSGDTLRFRFRGKSGRDHAISVQDKQLARIVRRLRDLPGQELFGYVDDAGNSVGISSSDVNAYLRDVANDDFTAKDFRTWAGTLACALALDVDGAQTPSTPKSRLVAAIQTVAERLGNTPAVCKKSYIHPGVIDEFLAAGGLELVAPRTRRAGAKYRHALSRDESRVLAFIERLMARDEKAHLGKLLENSIRKAKRKKAA